MGKTPVDITIESIFSGSIPTCDDWLSRDLVESSITNGLLYLTNPLMHSKRISIDECLFGYRWFIAHKFYCLEVDPLQKLLPLPKNEKGLIHAEAVLWQLTLRMLERLNTHRPYGCDPALALICLIEEYELLLPFCIYSPTGMTMTLFRDKIGKENRLMQTLEANPFIHRRGQAFTAKIVKLAIQFAKESYSFYQEAWQPVIKARMNVATRLRNGKNMGLFTEQGRQTQGRKKCTQ